MPLSEVDNISPIVKELLRINPESVLDLGIGNGLYGCLVRNYLTVNGLTYLVGVEGHESYRNPLWGAYEKVFIEDFSVETHRYRDYDVVLCLDVIEHFEKAKGHEIIQQLLLNNRRVIVSVPVGVCPQGAVGGNEFERHRANWYPPDFDFYTDKRILHNGVCHIVSIKGAVE